MRAEHSVFYVLLYNSKMDMTERGSTAHKHTYATRMLQRSDTTRDRKKSDALVSVSTHSVDWHCVTRLSFANLCADYLGGFYRSPAHSAALQHSHDTKCVRISRKIDFANVIGLYKVYLYA